MNLTIGVNTWKLANSQYTNFRKTKNRKNKKVLLNQNVHTRQLCIGDWYLALWHVHIHLKKTT